MLFRAFSVHEKYESFLNYAFMINDKNIDDNIIKNNCLKLSIFSDYISIYLDRFR